MGAAEREGAPQPAAALFCEEDRRRPQQRVATAERPPSGEPAWWGRLAGKSSPKPTIGDIVNCTQRAGPAPERLGGRFHLGQCEWCDEPGSGESYRLAALIAGANLNERQRRIRRHQGYRRDGLREAGAPAHLRPIPRYFHSGAAGEL